MDHERDIKTEPEAGIEFSTTELEYLAAIHQLLQEQAQEAEPKPVRIIDVANKLGKNRSTVWSGIKRLEARGIVETEPKKGTITLPNDAKE
ncbi:MAG: hypothetical protein IJJ45_04140 [Clostridia bacterium]|nr:hypothetical protein [Clostridia bacterium]